MIEVEGLSKNYGNHKAIENVSFSIKRGEIVGLLGLNGAGKSTILKMLGCFLVPSSGRATIGGVSTDSDPDAIRRMIGYLPDTAPLYNEMTVQAYLEYVAQLKDVKRSELKQKVSEAMRKTNLHEVSQVVVGELSHGFRQRVSIAQALVHTPEVLILDEPINGLDPVQIVEMRDLIVSLKGKHTVILSSHILSEITRTCDRILIINDGKLVAEGKEADLEGKLTQNMRLTCEVLSMSAALTDKIQKVSGVKRAQAAGNKISIETSHDVRAEISKVVVESGAGLLSLSKDDKGLEAVFMGLIQGSQHSPHKNNENIH